MKYINKVLPICLIVLGLVCTGSRSSSMLPMEEDKALVRRPFEGLDIMFGDASADAEFMFGEPTNLGPTFNSPAFDEPSISADGLELYFRSNRPGGFGNYDLYVTTRATKDDPWNEPANLGPMVNTARREYGPNISADGLTLFFTSDRTGGYGKTDLWMTTRPTTNDMWAEPVNLGPSVNSSDDDVSPCISFDGLSLYFNSRRPGGSGNHDLWVTTRATKDDPWNEPANLGPMVNAPTSDNRPYISADGLWLFFVSNNRPGGFGRHDIWVTRRQTKNDDWSTLVNLGPPVNSPYSECDLRISADGSTFYFASDRAGGRGNFDMWQVSIEPVIDLMDASKTTERALARTTDRTSLPPKQTVQFEVPTLLSPVEGAELDNGRTDQLDTIVWDFDWSDVAGSTEYHLYVTGERARNPVINRQGLTHSSYHHIRTRSYVTNSHRFGWTWKVRAKTGGQWGEWSPTRSFHVESANTDPPPLAEAHLRIPEQMQPCAANLQKIHSAIKKYEEDKGKLPDWLSDLVPDYLSNEVLLCPNDAEHVAQYSPDPKLPCSYSWQFSPKPIPTGWDPTGRTLYRDWKAQQVKLFGDVVPMVRCSHHDGPYLNLSVGGQIWWSQRDWEYMFKPDYRFGEVVRPERQIASRANFTPWMNGTNYQNEFERQAKNRYYPVKIEGRSYKGENQYRAIFEPFLFGSFDFHSCHGLQEQAYVKKNRDLLSKGYKRICLHIFDDRGRVKRYQATWIRFDDESREQQRATRPTKQLRIAGVVLDEGGNLLEGVKLQVLPMSRREVISDSQGEFEIRWEPRRLGSRETVHYLVARLEERNLAIAVEIDEETETLDLKLKPGVTFTGEVVDPDGKGISNARIMIMLRVTNWGSTLGRGRVDTNVAGQFEVRAIPPDHKYSVTASAEGYGENRVEVHTDDATDQQLSVGSLSLPLATLSISGMVVDSDDRPIANASVNCSGEGQPYRRTRTDAEGKFTLEQVCAGRIRVFASVSGTTRLFGYIETDGGASDIKLVISESSPVVRYIPDQTPSLVGRSLPDLKNLGIALSTTDANDKMILVSFWDMEQRPSRYCMRELAKRADQLKEKGVIVLAVQSSKVNENALNEWVEDNNTPFPVGMIRQDVERIRFSWGVKALPWLILTDPKHIVRAEGFDLGGLEKKIETATLLSGDVDQIQLQISQGADVNTKDEEGLTALHLAARQGRKDAVELLLANGANINARLTGWPGWTPLHEAAAANQKEVAELLIAKGADINMDCARAGGGRFGGTPLHEAVFEGHRDMAELLISKGAKVNAKQSSGLTPLDVAAFVGYRDVVELLIARGADVNIRDKGGRTALRWAKHGRHSEIVELLQRYGANE